MAVTDVRELFKKTDDKKTAKRITDVRDLFVTEEGLNNLYGSVTNRLNTWLEKSNDLYKTTEDYYKNLDQSSYGLEGSNAWKSQVEDRKNWLDTESNDIANLLSEYGKYFDSGWIAQTLKSLKQGDDARKNIFDKAGKDIEYWSQFDSADDYTKWYDNTTYSKKYEGMTYADIQKALESTEGREKDWLTSNADYFKTPDELQAEIDEIESANDLDDPWLKQALEHSFGDIWAMLPGNSDAREEAKNRVAELTEIKAQVERNAKRKEFVAEATSDPDRDYYIEKGLSEGRKQDNHWEGLSYNIAWKSDIIAVKEGEVTASGSGYHQKFINAMKDDEYNTYVYLFGKYGEDEADEYLESIEHDINAREGERIKDYFDTKGIDYLFHAYANIERWANDMGSIFSEGYEAPSPVQMADQMLGSEIDGFEKVLWDVVGNITYQVPNILGGVAASSILGPGGLGVMGATAGGTVGQLGLTGLSSFGSAKQEMLNLGYSGGQATFYGLLTAASEVGLQYALGGIGKYAGVWSDDAVKALTKGINNAGAKFAIEFGADMLSEGIEESLQEILNPFFQKIAFGKNEGVDWEQVGYAGLLGALSAGVMNGVGAGANRLGNISTAKDIKKRGEVDSLKKIGNTFSADTLAYKLASKVDEKTSSWKLATLIKEMNGTLSDQNIADIKYQLVRSGMVESDADTISQWLGKAVDGDQFTASQRKVLENNPIVSRVFKKVIVDQNSTVNQRLNALMELEGKEGHAGMNIEGIYRVNKENDIDPSKTSELLADLYSNKFKRRNEAKDSIQKSVDAYIEKERKNLENQLLDKEKEEVIKRTKVSESGATTDTTTGKQITINRVTDTNGKTATYALADGSTISSKDVEYSDNDEGLLYEGAISLGYGADITNAIIHGIEGVDLPVIKYLNGVDEAIEYGRIGYPMDKISDNGFFAELPKSMQTYAYDLGKKSAKADTEKAQAKIDANKGKVEKARDGEVVKLYEESGLTSRQEASITTLGKVVSDITHNKVYIYDTVEKVIDGKKVRVFAKDTAGFKAGTPADNGFINKATGEIYIDLHAGMGGEGVILWTLSHELTHFVRMWSPAKFNVLADFLMAEYGKQGVDVQTLIDNKMANTRNKLTRDQAYEEVVADAMQTMFTDTDLASKLERLKNKDKGLWEKIKAFFRDIYERVKGEYKDVSAQTEEAQKVREMSKATIKRLSDLFADAIVDAGDTFANLDLDGIATSLPTESTATTDPNSMVAHSYRSFAEACGFEAYEDPTTNIRMWRFKGSSNSVNEVTEHQIRNSPIGALINYSATKKYISYEDAKAQYKMFAEIANMCIKQQDFAQAMQFVGSMVFTGMKANADKQYKTTYDFPSICTKTQAVIDAMSDAMIKKGAGLTKAELEALYRKVWEMGNPVPCPECYVFSRWVGIGGLLDNIRKYQDTYSKMSMAEVEAEYQKMKAEIEEFSKANGISFGKAKGKIFDLYAKEEAKLMDEIAKLEEAGDIVPQSKRDRLSKISLQKDTTKAMSWIHKVYFANESHTKVNPKYLVPNEVLFDLNAGETFATEYKEAWGFRTTQGAGYGKAITPYAEAVLGEGIAVTNNTTKTIKGKANRDISTPKSNVFLEQNGTLSNEAIRVLETARKKQLAQAFLGGQRLQSTSDARYENVTDYLIAAIEMQAMHSKAQVYTKVSGAVEAFNTWGFAINQSLMPLNSGITKDGRLKDTSSGGMKVDVAYANRAKFENAGTITIGVNDVHIRALFRERGRDFIIPYHASGGDQTLIREFRRIQDSKAGNETFVQSCDYSKTQSEKELPTSLLRELGYTDEQIADVEKFREQRLAILTRNKAVDMEYIRAEGNEVLSRLYDEFNGGIWDGVKLTKDTVGTSIFPNEYWDKSVDYDHSSKITEDYLEYCRRLGFLHKFSGKSIQYNKNLQKHQFIDVMGYNENGERVALTDLAYIDGDPSKGVEQFYWKTLTDRRMYGNDGKYLEQKFVTLGNADASVAETFAKDNEGSVREYSKEKSDATLKTIKVEDGKVSLADNMMFSERTASDFVTHMKDIVKNKGGWYAKEVFEYVEANPEINYIERIYSGDKTAKKDLEAFLNTINDTKVLENLSWFMCQAYGDKGRTWSWDEGAKYPYRGATRTFQNAVKKRINAIVSEQVGGTNLGIKNSEVSLQDTKALYDRLNGIEEFKPLAEKVFATAEKLGVNIRFANQVFSSKKVAGDNLGDMVEYKTSYFNDTAYTDQHKANTILHELIHACTVYVMEEDSKYNFMGEYGRISGKSAEYVKLRNAGTRLNQILDQIQRDPDFKGQYGLTNSKEMVAELANEKFVGLLKKKSLWDRIIEAIADIFGFIKGNTAYDGAMQCLNYILDNPDVSEYKAFVKEQRENARYNGMDVFGKTEYTDYYGNNRVMFSERTEAPPTKTEKAYKLMRLVDGKLYPLFIGNNEEVKVGAWYNADSPNLSQLKNLAPGTHLVDMKTGEAMTWDEYAEKHVPKKNGKPKRNKPNIDDVHWANDNGYRFMHIEEKAGGTSESRMLKQYGDTRAYYNWGVNGSSKSESGEGSASLYALRPGWHFGEVPTMHQIGYDGVDGDTVRLDNQVWVEVEMSADVDYNAEAASNWGGDIPTHIPTNGYYKFATNPTQKKTKGGNTEADLTKSDWYVAGAFKVNRILSDSEADSIVENYNKTNGKNVPLDYRRNYGRVFNAETMSLEDRVAFSERNSNATDNRTLLANALESVAQNDVERSWLAKYKAQIGELNAMQNELSELRAEIQKTRFTTGKDRSKLPALENQADILAEKINRADRKLLNLEVSKPLQKVIDRERAKAYKLGMEKLANYRKERAESKALHYYRPRIEKIVSDLSNRLEHPSAKTAIPEAFGASVAKVLSAFNFTTYDKDGNAKPSKASVKRAEAKRDLETLAELLGQNTIEATYGQLDIPPEMLEWIKSVATYFDAAENLASNEFDVNKMNEEQLKGAYKFLRSLQTAINNAGRYYSNAHYNVMDDARSTMDYVGELPTETNELIQKASKMLKWDFASPVTVFDRFGEGGKHVYSMLVKGQSKMAYNVQDVLDFVEKAYTEKEAKEWREKLVTVKIGGEEYNVTIEMLMGLHCLLRQEDSKRHILEGGGIRFADVKHNGKVKRFKNIFFNEMDAMAVEKALDETPRAKEVAEAMQNFMEKVGSAWGNEVSMIRFGYHAFTTPNYYPIRTVAAGSEYEAQQKRANIYALLNKSFTKERTPGANNAVIVDGIFSVFNNHMAEMALYNAWALPVIDTIKWFNYKETQDIDAKTAEKSVHETFRLAYGNYADEYVRRLLESINSQTDGGLSEGFAFRQLRMVNRVAVSWNVRVALQQPFSLARAYELINPKYVTPLVGKARDVAYEEMLANSGIAKWKSMGYYDVDVSRPLETQVMKSATKADKFTEVGMKAAEGADSLAWSALWNACKKETAEQNKGISGEELLKKTAERFDDIVLRTQVVDTVLAKSQWMRSKSFWHRSTSAFMSEPLTSYNALLRQADKFARDKAIHGVKYAVKSNAKGIAKVTSVFVFSQLLNALITAPLDALRDDDDYETYLEKLLANFKENAFGNLMPWNMLPWVSDVADYFLYGRTDRADMAYLVNVIDLSKSIYKLTDNYSYYKLHNVFNKALSVASQTSGFAVSNIWRDAVAMWNAVAGELGYGELKFQTNEDAHTEGYKRMYDAIVSGDEDRIGYLYGQLLSNGLDEEKVYDGLVKRIQEDVKSGKITDEEATRLLKEIISITGKVDSEGNPPTDNDIYWMIDKWHYSEENGSTEGYSKYDDIFSAMEDGDPTSAIEWHIDKLIDAYVEEARATAEEDGTKFIETRAKREAETKAKSTVKSAITSHWKPLYKDAYKRGDTEEMKRIRYMLKATKLYGSTSELLDTVKGWLKS
jgi:hypothetical protein